MSDDPISDPELALDIAAAEVRADASDMQALVGVLAARLESALPRLVAVRRRKVGGFRSKVTEVQSILLSVGDTRFELARAAAGFECTRHAVVRGITLKREQLALGEWIREVISAVTHSAEVGERDRIALETLTGLGPPAS